jgi:hypothetical protein
VSPTPFVDVQTLQGLWPTILNSSVCVPSNLHSYLLNTVTSLTVNLASANHDAYRELCTGLGELVTGVTQHDCSDPS